MTTPADGPPPHVPLIELSMSVLLAQALYAVADLGIADRLATGPRTSVELAEAAGVRPGQLHQVLRSLSALGCSPRAPMAASASPRPGRPSSRGIPVRPGSSC